MPVDTHRKKHVKNKNVNPKITFEYADLNKGQNYAIVEKAQGQCRFQIKNINTGEVCISMLRGKLRGKKSKRVDIGDIVIITEGIASEILYKYSKDEIKRLDTEGLINGIKSKDKNACSVVFEDENTLNQDEELEIDISII